jgi:hypothetical protein
MSPIKKYYNFVNESKGNYSFIPYELRVVRRDTFNPEIKKPKDEDFLKKIEELVIDKAVKFYFYNYSINKGGGPIILLVKKVGFNATNVILLQGDMLIGEKGGGVYEHGIWSYALDEGKELEIIDDDDETISKIIIKMKDEEEKRRTKHLDIDPYGEEDWLDEYENEDEEIEDE